MKIKFALLALFTVAFATQSSFVSAQGFSLSGMGIDYDFCPYIGADVGVRHMSFDERFGGKLIKKNSPQGNLYLGLRLNDYLAVEAGLESTVSVRRTANILANDPSFFGATLSTTPSNAISTFITTSKIYGWHADLVGLYPIWEECGLSALAYVGVAELRLKVTNTPTLLNNGTIPVLPEFTVVFSHKKYVPRAGIGLQQMITKCAGIRGMLGWENTKRFRGLTAKGDDSRIHNASAKDSVILSFGVFYNF